MGKSKEQTGTQRYDAFFKKIFKQSINSFLDVLNLITTHNIGDRIISEMPEEVSKGILRADFIAKTNKRYILIFEFKDEIKIDAYFAINAYTATHIHTSKAYRELLSNDNKLQDIMVPYIPIIVGFFIQGKYKKHLTKLGIIKSGTRLKVSDVCYF
ncbi:MAG: hypothetical protein ACP6IU_14305 [Candidatus Asgardarchaeia archaeon]